MVGSFYVFAVLLAMGLSHIHASEELPNDLKGVGFTEKVGNLLPLEQKFIQQNGKEVTLGSLFGKKPVLLNMAYHSCPMLCDMLLNGLIDGARDAKSKLGKDYQIITISIDPKEELDVGRKKRKAYLDTLGITDSLTRESWTFLQGDSIAIHAVTNAIGFNYKKLDNGEFAHQAGIVVVSPTGEVRQYLYGLVYTSFTLDQALITGRNVQELSLHDKVMMFCYRYSPEDKAYVLFAENVMRASGGVVLAIVGMLLLVMWKREMRKKQIHTSATAKA